MGFLRREDMGLHPERRRTVEVDRDEFDALCTVVAKVFGSMEYQGRVSELVSGTTLNCEPFVELTGAEVQVVLACCDIDNDEDDDDES